MCLIQFSFSFAHVLRNFWWHVREGQPSRHWGRKLRKMLINTVHLYETELCYHFWRFPRWLIVVWGGCVCFIHTESCETFISYEIYFLSGNWAYQWNQTLVTKHNKMGSEPHGETLYAKLEKCLQAKWNPRCT